MPNSHTKYCDTCQYSPKNGYNTKMSCSDNPLSAEQNSSERLLIFQSPGSDEWLEKKPICSTDKRSTAARLRNAIQRIGKSRKDFSITNAVQCYPGKLKSGRDKKPPKTVIRNCAEWLKNDINSINYKKIIVFGSLAANTVKELGYQHDERFIYIKHPSGGLTNAELDKALSNSFEK